MFRTAILATMLATPAAAQQAQCGDHAAIVAVLAEKYGETLQVVGIESAGAFIQFFANTETGTWTIIALSPASPACLVADGRAWDAIRQEAPGIDG